MTLCSSMFFVLHPLRGRIRSSWFIARATMPRMSYARGVLLTALAALAFITLLITSPSLGAQAATGRRPGGAPAAAQPTRTVQDGVFSDAQATRGQALYAQRCAGCHGPALAGASAPALTGDLFTNKFRMEPLSALFIQIRYAMPPVRCGQCQVDGRRGCGSRRAHSQEQRLPRRQDRLRGGRCGTTARSPGQPVAASGQAARRRQPGMRPRAISPS